MINLKAAEAFEIVDLSNKNICNKSTHNIV